MTDSIDQPVFSQRYETRSLKSSRDTEFDLRPDAQACETIAEALGLLKLTKLRFSGKISASGKRDWKVTGRFGATVEQACISTLAPVRSRIDENVTRKFIAELPEYEEGSEIEMESDENADPLSDAIDVGEILTEALTLALPLYPRAEGNEDAPAAAQAAPKGIAPLTDADMNPFSALEGLKNKLENKQSDTE